MLKDQRLEAFTDGAMVEMDITRKNEQSRDNKARV